MLQPDIIFAFDLGTKCGVAGVNTTSISCYTWSQVWCIKKLKKDMSIEERRGRAFEYFYSNLSSLIADTIACGVDMKRIVIYYEKVHRHQGTDAAHMYGGYEAILLMWATMHGLRVVPVGVGTIKKYITGKGNASKEQVIAAINQSGYPYVTDDNEADALALLHYAMKQENN